jgi:hypothetical protein
MLSKKHNSTWRVGLREPACNYSRALQCGLLVDALTLTYMSLLGGSAVTVVDVSLPTTRLLWHKI